MSTTPSLSDPQPEEVHLPDPIQAVFTGECSSLSGLSTLAFEIGRHADDQTLHLRIATNSGGGMFYEGWAPASKLDEVVKRTTRLTAKAFRAVHPGRSVNTAGFLLAVLKHLGMARVNEENTRLHEHVPTTSFEQVAMAAMQDLAPGKKGRALRASKASAY